MDIGYIYSSKNKLQEIDCASLVKSYYDKFSVITMFSLMNLCS